MATVTECGNRKCHPVEGLFLCGRLLDSHIKERKINTRHPCKQWLPRDLSPGSDGMSWRIAMVRRRCPAFSNRSLACLHLRLSFALGCDSRHCFQFSYLPLEACLHRVLGPARAPGTRFPWPGPTAFPSPSRYVLTCTRKNVILCKAQVLKDFS